MPLGARSSLFFSSMEPPDGWLGPEAAALSRRARMLDAITVAVGEKGYSRVTVADVVRIAGVSRTTFYEQFEGKEECFLAAYSVGCDALLGGIVEAALAQGQEATWREVLTVSIDAYLATLASDPQFARTFLIDILGAGPAAVELRRKVLDQFVAQYTILSRRAAKEDPAFGEVAEIHLRAMVGGIAELVQQHLLAHEARTLPKLGPVLVGFVAAVMRGTAVRAAV